MSALTLLLILVVVEGICRIARPGEGMFEDPYENANTLFQMLRYHPTLGWSGRPDAKVMHLDEHLNSRGQRGPEFQDEKPAGVVRIVALGDSCTFNVQFYDVNREIPLIILEDPYPALLGRMLEFYDAPGRRYEVINAGVPGYSTLQGLRFLRQEALGWDPDVVLIRFGWNDHWFREPGYTLRPEPRNALLRWIYAGLRRSYFYRFMTGLVATLKGRVPSAAPAANRPPDAPPPLPEELRVPPEEFDFNLRLIIREARGHGAVPILINAPTGTTKEAFVNSGSLEPFLKSLGFGSLEDIFRIHAHYNGIVERVALQEDVPFIDLDAAFEERGRAGLFGPTEVLHPNREGNELAARLVLEELQRLGFVTAERQPAGTRSGRPPAYARGSRSIKTIHFQTFCCELEHG